MSYISAMKDNDKVVVWERTEEGQRVTKRYPAQYYFYEDDPFGEYTTIYNTTVSKREFTNGRDFYFARTKATNPWESDISAELRTISKHYYGLPAPKLHITLLDIEVDYDPELGFASPKNPYAPINAIALFHEHNQSLIVLAVPPNDGIDWTPESLEKACNDILPIPTEYKTEFHLFETEAELLIKLLRVIKDSDLLCGWNSDTFDFPYIAKRLELVLGQAAFKRLSFPGAKAPEYKEIFTNNHPQIKVETTGRLLADFMQLYKKYEMSSQPSYKLSYIADVVLTDPITKEPILPKLEYEGTLASLYVKNFAFFVRYNIRDCEILHGFEKHLGYIDLANQMYHLSGGLFQHVMGTLKLAELAIINYCHHDLQLVVNNSNKPDIDASIDGAFVLLPQIGQYQWFGSIDINSLYPSAIRSNNISPEMIRGQFAKKELAAVAIKNKTNETLLLELEDGQVESHTAAEWNSLLRELNWSISGYGTVFDQHKVGIIPSILATWYSTRKKYQALKYEADKSGNKQLAAYYDRLQYVYKIKLNSMYGALTNQFFRFYDLRMGESTTGTGRIILKHQCREVARLLDGKYDIDFPLYETISDAMDSGYSEQEALQIALDGPVFNGRFQTESVIYGDTDSTYFLTHAANEQDAIKIADAIAVKVNESFPAFMRETFLCADGFDNIIKTGREIVSDNGIFVEKKRYILHLVNLDGKKVDKMKIMGLDTKKTTLPLPVSKKLNGFVEQLLRGSTWEEVAREIVLYKEELYNSPNIMDIGLPKGVNNIERYTKNYQQDETTRLPGHVAAAIFYNICIKEYKDKTSVPITSGTKIKVFYITTSTGRFKSIAIPTDTEVVPGWFLTNFEVDKDAHITRLVDNPLSNILKAIGKKAPTLHSLKVESLFRF